MSFQDELDAWAGRKLAEKSGAHNSAQRLRREIQRLLRGDIPGLLAPLSPGEPLPTETREARRPAYWLPEEEPAMGYGLYGIPYSDSAPVGWGQPLMPAPGTAGGAHPERIWREVGGVWTVYAQDYWDASLPGGYLAGNVTWSSVSGETVSWTWRQSGGSSLANAVKYAQNPQTFQAWLDERWAASDTIQERIYNRGSVLVSLPSRSACIGASIAGGWLFAAALADSITSPDTDLIDSGAVQAVATTEEEDYWDLLLTEGSGPARIENGKTVVVDGNTRTVTAVDYNWMSTGRTGYTLDSPISGGVAVGTKIWKWGGEVVDAAIIFAIAVETAADGSLGLAPGAEWLRLDTRASDEGGWQQQFCASPDGLHMISLRRDTDLEELRYCRVTFTTGATPTATVAEESAGPYDNFELVETGTEDDHSSSCATESKMDARDYVDEERCVATCSYTQFGDVYTTGFQIRVEWVTGSYRTNLVKYKRNEQQIDIAAAERVIAADYLPDGSEATVKLKLSSAAEYSSNIEAGVEIAGAWSNSEIPYDYAYTEVPDPRPPYYPDDTLCIRSGGADISEPAVRTRTLSNYRLAAKSGSAALEAELWLNDGKLLDLGVVDESYSFDWEDNASADLGWKTLRAEYNKISDGAGPSGRPCETDITTSTGLKTSAGYYTQYETAGDGNYTFCSSLPWKVPDETWDFTGTPTCVDRIRRKVTFLDIAAGVVVYDERRGNIDDFDEVLPISLPLETSGDPDTQAAGVLLLAGVEEERSQTAVIDPTCITDAEAKQSTDTRESQLGKDVFFGLGIDYDTEETNDSGAACLCGSVLLFAHQPYDDPATGELRTALLVEPDGDPLALASASGTGQGIGKISAT